MKILIISWEFPPFVIGGISPHVKAISAELARLGVSNTVITRSIDGQFMKEEIDGATIIRVPSTITQPSDFMNQILESNFSYLSNALTLMNDDGYDLVHIHDWMTFHSGFILKHCYNIPLIATLHSTEFGRSGGIHNEINRYINSIEQHLTNEADRLIVCSNSMKEEALQLFETTDKKIRVIYNGINIKETPISNNLIEEVKKLYSKNKKYLITYIGRLVHQKGVDLLIDAMVELKAELFNITLAIVGAGYMQKDLINKARESGIEDMINFTGFVSEAEKETLIQASDLLVFPSRYEPFGIVALEALAWGKPVIVSDVGGFREVIVDGETGIRVQLNPLALAEGIKFLIHNKMKAKNMGNKGKEVVKNMYSWQNITRKLLEVYNEVLIAE